MRKFSDKKTGALIRATAAISLLALFLRMARTLHEPWYVSRNPSVMKTTFEKDYEVDNTTGMNHEGPMANTPVRRLTATSIIGDKVENPQGDDLGKIDNLMINIHDGRVEYAVIEKGAFLGIGGKLFAIPFSELQLDPVREVFVLNRSKEYLDQVPGFDKSHWPDTNAHTYFNEVNTYWGTTSSTPNTPY